MNTEDYLTSQFLPSGNTSWEMTIPERIVFTHILNTIKPNRAMEIGSRNGGSLEVICRIAKSVTCIDIDETIPERLSNFRDRVSFVIGDSKMILKEVLEQMSVKCSLPSFIHIDGDHTVEGAASDLDCVLSINPKETTFILMHDTFNEDVRKGILSLNFEKYRNLHYCDLDFMGGVFHTRPIVSGEMWGGFSIFILEPVDRVFPLKIENYYKEQFEFVAEGAQKWRRNHGI